jgi:hypothetical protein
MKKEYSFTTAAILFLISYLVDRFSGVVNIVIKNPFLFINQVYLTQYPLTALAIGFKALGLLISVVLILSFIEKLYFAKAGIVIFVGIISELYAIQQTATGMRTTPIQWTLSFALAGILFIIPFIYYIIKGIVTSLYSKLSEAKEVKTETKEESIISGTEKDN